MLVAMKFLLENFINFFQLSVHVLGTLKFGQQ